MKIGILTYHSVPNFGAQLQTISMVGFFKKRGFSPVVINWYPDDLRNMYKERIPLNQMEIHEKFAEEHIPMTRLCTKEQDVVKVIKEYNLKIIVIGSDAVFKYVPYSLRSHFSLRKLKIIREKVLSVEEIKGNPFWGGFCNDIKDAGVWVFAFSASSQNCQYKSMSHSEKELMKENLSCFKDITVRDNWTKSFIESILGNRKVSITPDPVFAFNTNSYLDIPPKTELLKKYNIPDNYVLISFRTNRLSKEYIHSLSNKLEEKGLESVSFPMPEGLKDFCLHYQIQQPISPIDWYSLIIHSKGYIGERMHPIIVCLHNSIPFFVFDEYGIIQRHLGGLIRIRNIESSKTFHIVKEAGFLEQYYSYYSYQKLPQTSDIVDKILHFDVNRCKLFSNIKQVQFLEDIDCIIKQI